jgi:hypothetical protein
MLVLSRDSRLVEQAHCLGYCAGNFVLLNNQLVHPGCLIAASNTIAVGFWLGAGTVITSGCSPVHISSSSLLLPSGAIYIAPEG